MKLPVFALLCAASLSACAQPAPSAAAAKEASAATAEAKTDPAKPSAASAKSADEPVKGNTPDERARNAILKLAPTAVIDRMGPAPIAGFREAIVSGQVLYISDDGRYLMQGALYDIQTRQDLSQVGMSELRKQELKKIPQADRIVFAPAKPKHTVTVFTDIECGFCRKLHQEIAEYNRLGIAIEYLAFPRAGLASEDFKAMESVWCSVDRRKALTDAKNGQPVAPKRCTNPVTVQYKLGQRIGLQGTPMIVNEEGMVMPGYMPPAQLLEALDKLAAEAKAKPVAAAGAP
ncbi:MAG: DsbC family protein [Lysobacteraceae bacterium]|nr:MAG: DsbC family protein [Xanthomonadaceae bacterium]